MTTPLARLSAAAATLDLQISQQYAIRPAALICPPLRLTLVDEKTGILAGDLLLLLLEWLADRDKCALCGTCRCLRDEQRRLKPEVGYRARMSLALLRGARNASWHVRHCHVDKRAGIPRRGPARTQPTSPEPPACRTCRPLNFTDAPTAKTRRHVTQMRMKPSYTLRSLSKVADACRP